MTVAPLARVAEFAECGCRPRRSTPSGPWFELATIDEGVLVKTDDLAKAQGIPPQFLVDILSDLRTDRLVRSHRGREGGYELARPAAEISIADVLRCIDGPLASVRDIGLGDLPYSGPTAALTDVWRALRPNSFVNTDLDKRLKAVEASEPSVSRGGS